MNVKSEPLRIHELEAELEYYETEYGLTSAAFAEAYANGRAPEILEEIGLEWMMAYEAWRLVGGTSEQSASFR